MNHIYRIVFNRSLGVYQCVSELAKADGKSSGRSATHCRQSGLILSSLSIAMLSMILIDGAQATTYNGGYYTNLNEPVDKDGNTYPDPYPYPSAYIVGNDVVENVGTELVARYAIVGSSGSGKLTIRDQGKFFSDKVIVGNQLGSDGKVIVNNAGLLVGGYFNQREGKLIIGNYGKGSVTIEKGAFADVDRSIEIGNYENAIGELIVTGANSNLFMDDFLKIGNSGQGKVITADGAVVGVGGQVVVGTDTSGLGELLVTDVDTELFIGDDLIVGKAGKGSARIANGGAVEAKDVSIGEDAGSEANLAITDSNSYLRADGSLEIGVEGTGSVTLAEGALVEANGVSIGLSTDSEGDLTVTGSNSKLNIGSGFTDGSDLFIENDLYIGNEGKGKVTIADGGLVQAKDVHIGKEKDGEGDLTVTGSNSKLSSEDLVIGNKGKGIATIADGGLVQAKYAGIGQTKSSEGELTVIGNNSKLSVDIDLTIGYSGKGSATIADGALVEANSVDIGKLQDGKGDLTVTGNNSKLSVNRDLTVGYSGKGSAVIADGSSIETKYVSIGSLIDSEGDLNVTGSDSKLSAEELIIGEAGKGIATIADEGLVQANVISLGKTGKGTLNIIDNGLVVAKDVSRDERAKSSVINFDNGTLALLEPERLAKLFNNFTADSTINLASGGGTIDTNKFDITVFDDARITGNGSFTKAGTGKLVMNSANKAWTGNTNINQGVLELNGNYIMRKGEILGIGLNSLTDYGQLNVIGKADISKGTLMVNASNAVQALTGGPVWNNVVSANNLNSKFSAISDNSPLVSFVADYRYLNTVNLKMTASVTPPVNNLVVGNAGKRRATIAKGKLVNVVYVYIGTGKDGEGDLTVIGSDSTLSANNLVIGGEGKGTLNITDNGLVVAKNVGRNKNSQLSVINFDNGTLELSANQLALFNNFTSANTINLASGGGTIDTNKFDITVFDDARITGNGSFTKAGTGKLVMNSANKAWTGSTNINQGVLELNGNYIMRKGEILGIGLNSLTDYGQLNVIGKADISKGTLMVNASNAVQALTGGPVWNNVVSANNLNSKFVAVNDNSPLVSFVADYSDANTVHLKMTAPVIPPVVLPVNHLVVGKEGKESMTIANGKLVQAIDVSIGENAGSEGNLTVTGSNSKLIADNLNVGMQGKGTLNIIENGLVVAKNIGRDKNSQLSVINFDNGTLELLPSEPSSLLFNNSNNRTLASSAQDQSSLLFNNFTADNTINLASGGGTIDTNNFDATIFDNARITGNGSFTKAGTGKLSMNSATKAWTGNTNINQGVLELNGDYIMRKGEVLGIGLNSLTDYGQLKVTGNADISKGTLMVNASNAVQTLTGGPVWNNVVSANNLNSKFVAVNDNSPLVSFVADYSDANTVHLKMTAPVTPPVDPVDPPVTDTTFVKAVESQANQTALGLADALDQAIQDRVNNGNNALADALISNTLDFNNLKLATAANELQPLLMGATNRIIADTNYAAAEAVTERSLTNPNRGVWAKIIGSESSHDEEGGISGYDADRYGAIVGIDTPINDNLNLGVAFSYIDSDVDSNSSTLNHEMTAKNWQILGYGNYAASDATQINFHAGAGSSDVEGQRHIAVLTNATANSDYSVDTLQAGFGIGHRIGNELRNFTPFAQMNYARAESDGYRETGAGVYNLDVDENTYESLRWTAGVKMSQALTPKLALTGQLAAAIENGDRRSDITASFIDMPNANFTTIGQEIGREIGIVGIGLSYMPTANTKLSAGYRGEWRDNYDDQGASIALQTTF